MNLSKTYDHDLNENTPNWAQAKHRSEINPRVTALDDAVVYLCWLSMCSDNDRSHVRLVLGQMCESDVVSAQELSQLSERAPALINGLSGHKGISYKQLRDIVHSGKLKFSDIEAALTSATMADRIRLFQESQVYKTMARDNEMNKAMSDLGELISVNILSAKYFNHIVIASIGLLIGLIAWEF